MKLAIPFFIMLWLITTPITGMAQPSRVVSINLCTDQLLLMLADPGQITSISDLALKPDSSYMAEEAAGYPINHARAEELLVLNPDLILASDYSNPVLIHLLRKLGYRVETFPAATSIEHIRQGIRRMAALLEKPESGEKLITMMDRRLNLAIKKQPDKRPKAIFYQPNGYTSGSNTLQDTALTLAGWKNLAREQGIHGYGTIDLETLLLAGPDQLFSSAYTTGTYSLAQRRLTHPALNLVTQGRNIINIDYKYWICGGPMIADAVERLQESLPE